MHNYPSTTNPSHMWKDLSFLHLKLRLILSLMGKESSFLPQKCKANLPHTGKESCFLPRMLKVHPSPGSVPKCNSTLPHRGKDSSPFKMQNLHNPFPTNYFLYLFFFFFFHYYLIYLFIFSFFPKLGILPQSEKVIPQHLGRIIEE